MKFQPETSVELHRALATVCPGDEIILGPRMYQGDFTLNAIGPIKLTGTGDPEDPNIPHTIIIPDDNPVLKVMSDSWTISKLEIRLPLVILSSNNVFNQVVVHGDRGEPGTNKSIIKNPVKNQGRNQPRKRIRFI